MGEKVLRGKMFLQYRINNVKISVTKSDQISEILKNIAAKIPCKIEKDSIEIRKKSLDARKKNNIQYVYTVDFKTVKVIKNPTKYGLEVAEEYKYHYPQSGLEKISYSPVIFL